MKASVAVIPRERFSQLPASLQWLFKTIDEDVPVIVVDGGAPDDIREQLYRLRAERPFELVECEDFTLPNKARNIALDRVETKYVAFCDNDLGYWPGWLDALVENAEVNGSAAVAPLILIGPGHPPRWRILCLSQGQSRPQGAFREASLRQGPVARGRGGRIPSRAPRPPDFRISLRVGGRGGHACGGRP
jgi:glycosyltransferase involved in cell wall biosynthesis